MARCTRPGTAIGVRTAYRTVALTNLFHAKFSKPNRTYITGASMGGHITGIVAEQWPLSYDGAMPICRVLGDYELFDYFLDFNPACKRCRAWGICTPLPRIT